MSTNGNFLKHTNCPKCGSRDNLGIYDDHEYCFGCGYINQFGVHTRRVQPQQPTKPPIALPDDCEPRIPFVALDWIKQYELTTTELLSNRVLWSERRELLVFPYFEEDRIIGWQGRYLGKRTNHPKWFTSGDIKSFVKTINLTQAVKSGIIYVEDIVSAIKVGRQVGTCPVFGSFIPKTHSIALHKQGVKQFYIWLDNDKYREAHRFSKEINNLGLSCKVIHTELDPKCYSDTEIERILQ